MADFISISERAASHGLQLHTKWTARHAGLFCASPYLLTKSCGKGFIDGIDFDTIEEVEGFLNDGPKWPTEVYPEYED
jgi:hypothetical protein